MWPGELALVRALLLALVLYLLVACLEIKTLVVGAALIVAVLAVLLIRGNDQPCLECHLSLSFGVSRIFFLVHDRGTGKLAARGMTGLALNAGEVNVLIGGMALNALGILLLLIVQFIKRNGMFCIFPGLIDLNMTGFAFLYPDVRRFLSIHFSR